MNTMLKIGIMWIIISVPMLYFIKPVDAWRPILVVIIGSILTTTGFIINEYQVYKFEKNINL